MEATPTPLSKAARTLFATLGIICLVLSFAVMAVGTARLATDALPTLGYGAYDVSGTSMEPYAHDGDLVVVQLGPDANIGDPIVFYSGEGKNAHLIYHRVLQETYAESGGYVTKGDNNPAPDRSEVSRVDVVGSEVAHIPNLGFLASHGHSDNLIAFLAGVLGIAVSVLVLLIASGRLVVTAKPRLAPSRYWQGDIR